MNIQLMPGKALITLDAEATQKGGILLPEVSHRGVLTGTVEQIRYGFPRKCIRCGRHQTSQNTCRECGHSMKILSADNTVNPFGMDVDGKRVMFKELAVFQMEGRKCIVPVDTIIAILPLKAKLEETRISNRCRYCGPATEGTVNGLMMVADASGTMYCPRCKRYSSGMKKTA